MTDLSKLSVPFPPDAIEWRVGSTNAEKTRGMALAYIDARSVMERLDEVCGKDGWQCEYSGIGADKTCCRVGIRTPRNGEVGGDPIEDWEWIWKADGAGDTDFEAAKGAFSDAFKRAAVKWGIGRYLYALESPWVEIEPMGKTYRIKPAELSKLKNLLGRGWEKKTVKSLRDEIVAFAKDLDDCLEYDQLIGLLNTSKALLEQCQADKPLWWFGDGGDSAGLAAKIEAKKKELAGMERV